MKGRGPRSNEGGVSGRALWFGLLAGPVAWSLHVVAAAGLSSLICAAGQGAAATGSVRLALGLLSVAALGVTAAGIFAGSRSWQASGDTHHWRDSGGRSRVAFMAIAGILVGTLSLAGILYGTMPIFLASPCEVLP